MIEQIIHFIGLWEREHIIQCLYHGKHDITLKGNAMLREDMDIDLQLTIDRNSVARYSYNTEIDSLDIWYDKELKKEEFPMTRFSVLGTIKRVNIYDADQKEESRRLALTRKNNLMISIEDTIKNLSESQLEDIFNGLKKYIP